MEKFYFVMPAYNETINIANTIAKWYPIVEKINQMVGCEAVLVIANDGSTDNTYEIMLKMKIEEDLDFFEPLTKLNGGHGQTVFYLYRYALRNGADYVFQTDSDGQTSPNEFWQMFEHRHDFDFQIGYRKNRQDGISRVFVTKILRLIIWLVLHEWVTDANTPFRLMRKDKLQAIMSVVPEGYPLYNVAISIIAVKWKYRVKFCEITFTPRFLGVNSVNMKYIFKMGRRTLGDFWKINNTLRKYHKN